MDDTGSGTLLDILLARLDDPTILQFLRDKISINKLYYLSLKLKLLNPLTIKLLTVHMKNKRLLLR